MIKSLLMNRIRSLLTKILKLINKNLLINKIFSIIKNISDFKEIKIDNNDKIFLLDTNWLTRYRIESFYTKEPETIEWINNFISGSFWDIGANVGLYSIYASKINDKIKVISFEPSVLNLEILVKNIYQNKQQNNIKIITNPLSNNNKFDKFYLSNLDKSGANSSFGTKIDDVLNYTTNSLNCEQLRDIYNLEEPKYVKIDIDGNELEVLQSIFKVFHNIHSFLIEVDHQNKKEILKIMENNNYEITFSHLEKKNIIFSKVVAV